MDIEIENIVLFVGDAVRYDYSHNHLAERGQTHKTIAASLHTPASFGSIFSGYHVPQHGIISFRERYPKNQFNLFDLNDSSDYTVRLSPERGMNDSIADLFSNSIQESYEELEPPFIWMHRDPGGHAPYGEYDRMNGGYTRGDNSTEYLNRMIGETKLFREDYQRGVDESIEYFDNIIAHLKERGLADNTLFIYTSDHGEILGEYGFLGHNHLGCPELVYVPTTFVHPDIEPGYSDQLLHNVDIPPTILDLLGLTSQAPSLEGKTVRETNRKRGYNHFENTFYTSGLDRLNRTVRGLWESEGGHVFVDGGRLDSTGIFTGLLLKSPHGKQIRASRKITEAFFRFYRDQSYEDPETEFGDAREICKEKSTKHHNAERRKLSDEEIEHLSNLGYV